MTDAQWAQYDERTWLLIRTTGGHLGMIQNVTEEGAAEEVWLYRTQDAAGETYSKRQAMRTVQSCVRTEAEQR